MTISQGFVVMSGGAVLPATYTWIPGGVTPGIPDAEHYIAFSRLTRKNNKLFVTSMRHDVNTCSIKLFTELLQLTQCVSARHNYF